MDNLTDSDLLEMGVKRRRSFSWSALLLVLTLVAAGGFAVSVYLPLHRAHGTLQAEYSALATKARELDDALQATKAELDKVDKRREELQEAEDARANLRKTGKENFNELKTILADERTGGFHSLVLCATNGRRTEQNFQQHRIPPAERGRTATITGLPCWS